jgi:DNA gyrase subunit A
MEKDKKMVKQKISMTLQENFMPYAMSVIVSRAIPEIDGFKPSHRKLLYTMYKMGLLKGNRTKSANVVGQTMKLNPHGDQAIYETLVRLTRGHEAVLHPYIDSKGNFGKSTSRDMRYAAARYTEARLDDICNELFKDIDKDTVDFIDNYDTTMKEPVLLPTTFPNVLVNANKGIAVGMASSISSFNLAEICQYTISLLEGKHDHPSQYLTGPDFSTGAYLLYDEKALRSIYDDGLGSIKLRSKFHYVKSLNCIEITEIPYTTTVEAIIDKIIEMIKSGRIKELSDVRDETDLKGLRITLDLKRGVDPDVLMHKLFKFTPLEDSFSCNFNILIDGRPKVLGVKSILQEWIRFRMTCIVRQLTFELVGLNEKLHLLLGLERVLLDIDKAIRIIRETEEDQQVIGNLMQAFRIDDIQADFVANIRLRNLNKDYLIKRIDEIVSLKKMIDDKTALKGSDIKIRQLMISELKGVIKKYNQPRKTIVLKEHISSAVIPETMIEDYNVKLFLTDHGYFKKITLVSLRANALQKIKDDDVLMQECDASNLSDVLLFSNKQNVYKLKCHEISEHKASELGHFLSNLLELEEGERILYMHPTTDYKGHLILGLDNGKMAKVPLASYETKQNRKKLINAYTDKGKLVRMLTALEDVDLAVVRTEKDGTKTMIVFTSALIPEKTTRNTQGVQIMRLKKDSYLSSVHLTTELNLESLGHYTVDSVPVAGTKLSPMDNFSYPDL